MDFKTQLKFIPLLLTCGLCVLFGTCIVGCSGQKDAAPTNTGKSEYMGSGDTAADKIGADRAAAHRPRLPGKGADN